MQRRQHRAIRARQFAEVTVGSLLGRLNPIRQMRDILRIGKEGETRDPRRLETQQRGAGLGNGKPVRRGLREHAHKSEFGDGATGQTGGTMGLNPGSDPRMEFVVQESKRDERIYIQQVDHRVKVIG